jgi:hypothetical protein
MVVTTPSMGVGTYRKRHGVSKGREFDETRPLLELLDAHEDELPDDWL